MNDQRPYRAIPIDGKEKGKKKFVYGWYFERGKDAYIINNEGFLYPHIAQPPLEKGPTMLCLTEEHFIEVIPSTVGQAIGQQDIHKKEIYQGDLIRGITHSTGLYEVVWCEMWAGFFRKVIEASEYEPNGSELQPLSIDGAKDHEIVQEVKP